MFAPRRLPHRRTVTTRDLRGAANEQRTIWNDVVGDAWVRHADLHDRQAAPFGEAAMQAIGAVSGAVVLDVGCGTGATTLELADRGAAHVRGVDISLPMIDAARAANASARVRFTGADVLELDEPGTYDVIFSRFGVMFFADPAAGFAHLRRLAARGARLGFCCWGPPAENPWMAVPLMATIPVLGPPQLPGPGEPGPFSLSSPEVVADLLEQGGWTDVAVRPLTLEQAHPAGSAEAVARVVVELSPPIVQGLRQQPERIGEACEAIAGSLRPLERNGIVHLQASALIVGAKA
jgi:SAM-dependent methyltransferase